MDKKKEEHPMKDATIILENVAVPEIRLKKVQDTLEGVNEGIDYTGAIPEVHFTNPKK